jgi:hypothetical protein
MTSSAKAPDRRQALARLRLVRMESPEPRRERPPVFHVFEELYARTLRELEPRSRGTTLVAGR